MNQQLWNRYSIASDNARNFVYAKTLDEKAGKELANKNRTVKRLVSKMVDGTTLEVDDLVQKITTAMQSFDCSSSRNHAEVNSTGRQRNTVEQKTEEPGQVFLFRNNATRILTF